MLVVHGRFYGTMYVIFMAVVNVVCCKYELCAGDMASNRGEVMSKF